MKTINFSQTRQHLATTFDKVIEDSTPIIVTRQNKEAVVIISLKDYRAMEETAYLMQSEANAQRLNRSIAQLEAGEGEERELIES
ncbi:MAG: type II toxin-antitoxin system prevent-host-death family antitoxin [Campylobacterota bacterium]|nr:type II toxin-antitoxin system prevent-host-death family antitoxin [Campylobacterota bacterium]